MHKITCAIKKNIAKAISKTLLQNLYLYKKLGAVLQKSRIGSILIVANKALPDRKEPINYNLL